MLLTKSIPNVKFAEIPQGYAKFLACGYDSIQESFDVSVTTDWAEKLFALRYEAEASACPISFNVGDDLQMQPIGASGFKYRIENDDFQLLIRDPAGKQKDWQITVRYLSAGLWEYGYTKLKDRVIRILNILCFAPNSDDWQRVTRCDFCFDFYSEQFSAEMTPEICTGIIGTNKTKQQINGQTSFELETVDYNAWLKAGIIETITIGNKGSLQVSVYDKTKEIKEASGKTWFYKIWGQEYKSNVYRLEIRMAKEWLRNRNINTMEQIENYRAELINEALIRRRLAVVGEDTNKTRWKIHPLWAMAYEINGKCCEIMTIGHQVTTKKDELKEMLVKQVAGCVRSIVVLQANKWDEAIYVAAMKEISEQLFNDPQKNKKLNNVIERYKYAGEAA